MGKFRASHRLRAYRANAQAHHAAYTRVGSRLTPHTLRIPILRNRTEHQLQAISLASLGFIYIGWMFGHLGFLANPTPGGVPVAMRSPASSVRVWLMKLTSSCGGKIICPVSES